MIVCIELHLLGLENGNKLRDVESSAMKIKIKIKTKIKIKIKIKIK
jgi:hypothetical protein